MRQPRNRHARSCGRTAAPRVQAAFTAANAAFEQARPASAAAPLAIGRAAPPIRADSAAAPSGMEVAESELASAGAAGSAEAELRGTKRSHGEAAAGSPPLSASAAGGAAALPRAAALSQLVVTEEDATVDEALFPTGKLDVEGQQAWLGPLRVRFPRHTAAPGPEWAAAGTNVRASGYTVSRTAWYPWELMVCVRARHACRCGLGDVTRVRVGAGGRRYTAVVAPGGAVAHRREAVGVAYR